MSRHELERLCPQEHPVRVPRQLLEVELSVKRLRFFIDAVEDDGDEREGPASFVAIPQGLGEESTAESLALERSIDAQPGQDRDGKPAARQSADCLRREVGEVDLSRGQRVVTRQAVALVEQDASHREVLFLILEGLGRQPVIDLGLAGAE
jgi:hypothetical protein